MRAHTPTHIQREREREREREYMPFTDKCAHTRSRSTHRAQRERETSHPTLACVDPRGVVPVPFL